MVDINARVNNGDDQALAVDVVLLRCLHYLCELDCALHRGIVDPHTVDSGNALFEGEILDRAHGNVGRKSIHQVRELAANRHVVFGGKIVGDLLHHRLVSRSLRLTLQRHDDRDVLLWPFRRRCR